MLEELKLNYGDLFEEALLQEINYVGVYKEVSQGSTLIQVGQYINLMPLLISGAIKIFREDKEGDEFVLPFLISFKSNKEFLDQDDYSDEDIKYTLINRGNFLPTLNQELGRFDFLYLDDKDRFWEMSDVGKDASIENVSNDEINYAGS